MTCLVIWNDMMTEITRASTAMQSADISRERMGLFEKAVTDARLSANECDASTEFAQKRNRKRKTFRDEVNAGKPGHQDAQLHFKHTVLYVIVETQDLKIWGRFSEKFRFILQMSEISKEYLE